MWSDAENRFPENLYDLTIEIGRKSIFEYLVAKGICAVLNSGGGVVKLKIADSTNLKKLDTFWQTLQNKWLDKLITRHTYDKIFDRYDERLSMGEVFLFIKALDHWCTLKFNLFLASDAKVLEASYEETLKILLDRATGKKKDYCRISLESLDLSLPKEFVHKEALKLPESKKRQYKHFPSDKPLLDDNSCTQRQAIAKQISAFANASGGTILLGVEDDGKITGQDLSSPKNKKDDVERRIQSLIREMKWPCICEKKIHWNVKFYPVKGKESWFIIGIFVAGLRGGVFVKNPESYELSTGEDGQEKVLKLDFSRWKKQMLRSKDVLQLESRALQEVTRKLKLSSLSKGCLVSVKGSTEKILESFFKVEAECPISPKGFEENLPQEAQQVAKEIQKLSSVGYTHALLVGSRSLLASVSKKDEGVRESLSVDGVICDLLLFNSKKGGLHLFTLFNPDKDNKQVRAYSFTTAKILKKLLVVQGGCAEKFYITPHVVPCHSQEVEQQIGPIFPDNRYPKSYDLAQGRNTKVNKILESLVNVLAVIPSALSSKMGISLFNLLTKEQFELVYQEIDRSRSKELWIKGVAGTGKTIVAVEFINELRRRDPSLQNENILYVCENAGLKRQISEFEVCKCLCRKDFMLMSEEEAAKVKHIVMDEVQSFRDADLRSGGVNWLQFARKLVRQRSCGVRELVQEQSCGAGELVQEQSFGDLGYLWLFIDNHQINHHYPTGIPPEEVQKPYFTLTQVVRNSRNIVNYAVAKLNHVGEAPKFEMGHDFDGEKVSIKTYPAGLQIPFLKEVVKSLLNEGYCKEDIAILYGKQEVIPIDLEEKLDVGEIVQAEENTSKHLVVSTFRKFSGQERPVVILVNLSESLPFNSRPYQSIYCSATRAMVKLELLNEKGGFSQRSQVLLPKLVN